MGLHDVLADTVSVLNSSAAQTASLEPAKPSTETSTTDVELQRAQAFEATDRLRDLEWELSQRYVQQPREPEAPIPRRVGDPQSQEVFRASWSVKNSFASQDALTRIPQRRSNAGKIRTPSPLEALF